LPKEFEITDSRLKEIPDDELEFLIGYAKRHFGREFAVGADSGKETPPN
jgi:hypothetical protein